MGVHTTYTPEWGDRICHKISTNIIGTNKLCEMDKDFPSEDTIYEWRWKYPDFAEKYAKAKSRQAELSAEKILELCDVETFVDEKGVHRADPGLVAIQRLKVDSVKWQASKLAPKIYGETKQTTHAVEGSLIEKIMDKL